MLEIIAKIMNMSEEEIKNHPHLLVNVFDPQYKILYWNKQCEKYFGIQEDDAIGKKLEDLLPGTIQNEKIVHLYTALAGEPVYVVNGKYDRKNGMYDQVVLPLKYDDGTVFAALNIVIDLLQNREELQQVISLPHDVYIKYSSN